MSKVPGSDIQSSDALVYAANDNATNDVILVGRTVAEVERELILSTLRHCLGNRTRTAGLLGISVRTLRNKLHEYAGDGVSVPPPPGNGMRGEAP